MNPTPPEASDTVDREIVITRVVNAPRALVFSAWTDPEHVGTWWGPNGFTNTIHEMDVRPGGIWRYIMHGPDGTDYQNRVQYEEVLPPEKLSYIHGTDEEHEQFRATVLFEEHEGKTQVTLRLLCDTPEKCAEYKAFGAVEGGEQTLGRFAAYLESLG